MRTKLPSVDYHDTVTDDDTDYVLPPPIPPPTAHERRLAEALADVTATHEELRLASDTIAQLRADLAHCQNRIVMIEEERVRYRSEALIFRSKLIELATAMSNISLLCGKAVEVMTVVNDLTSAPTNVAVDLATLEQETLDDQH